MEIKGPCWKQDCEGKGGYRKVAGRRLGNEEEWELGVRIRKIGMRGKEGKE